MDWDLLDFAVFGGMVLGVIVIAMLARRASRNSSYRLAVVVALAAAFLLVWLNGAVGIIGNEGNDANLMYFGVLATGLLGALIARFRPQGLSRAMLATAVAQAVVAAIAVAGDLGATAPAWPADVLVLTAFFVVLWLLSAWLFKRSVRRHYPGDLELRG